MSFFDQNADGVVSYEEFLSAMREPMSVRKSALVDQIWSSLCPKDNCIDLATISNDGFKYALGRSEGQVSKAEFYEFYNDICMQAPSDDYFTQHAENWWGVQENTTASVSSVEVERLVALLRQRLITLANGNQEEYALRRIFSQFDCNGNAILSTPELAGMLSKLGVDCELKMLAALFKRIDVNGNGLIEFEEFNNFVVHHQYK
jgi:Ca2+-binding EF-hand superfamily protein